MGCRICNSKDRGRRWPLCFEHPDYCNQCELRYLRGFLTDRHRFPIRCLDKSCGRVITIDALRKTRQLSEGELLKLRRFEEEQRSRRHRDRSSAREGCALCTPPGSEYRDVRAHEGSVGDICAVPSAMSFGYDVAEESLESSECLCARVPAFQAEREPPRRGIRSSGTDTPWTAEPVARPKPAMQQVATRTSWTSSLCEALLSGAASFADFYASMDGSIISGDEDER